MISNKYVNDYRLENVVNKKGRTVTKAVYVGKYYTFAKRSDEVESGKRFLLSCGIFSLVLFIIALAFYSNKGFSAQYYTLTPFIVCSFPLGYYMVALYDIFTFKEKCIREKKDHMHDRIAKCSFVCMLLSGITALGVLIALVLKLTGIEERESRGGDFVFLACAVMISVSFFIAFSHRDDISMKEIG